MKQFSQHLKTTVNLLSLAILLLILSTMRVEAQCPGQVDLQAVSIDPSATAVGVNQVVQIFVVMKNNGPCPIPTGEAKVQITLSSVYFDLGTPFNFSEICATGQYTFDGVISDASYHNLYFTNNGGPIPVDQFCYFQFDLKGKLVTPSPSNITLISSLSATAASSDINGTNQGSSTQLNVTTVLPVKLSTLSAELVDCKTLVKWKSEQEINSKEYQVEVSKDGRIFKTVGTVQSSSNSSTSLSYEFTHNTPYDGSNFYRLKMVSNYGNAEYSKTVAIKNRCNEKSIKIHPNPVIEKQLLTVNIAGYAGTLKGELLAISGQLLRTYSMKNGTNTLPIENISQGTYLLRVTELASGAAESFSVIVIK